MVFIGTDGAAIGGQYLQHDLPDELVLKILLYLYEFDLCALAQCCRRLNVIANDSELW